MSRNYELLQLAEKHNGLLPEPSIEPPFPTRCEKPIPEVARQVAGDMTQRLVERIFLDHLPAPPRMVVFAAIDHGNGCSQIAASVAETLAANASRPVCLVEANFRSPALPGILGTTNDHGLSDALHDSNCVKSFMKPLWGEKLWVLTSGPIATDSPDLLTSERMKELSGKLRNDFDFVIVDAPPVALYPDAVVLGKCSDGMVLVIEAGSSRRAVARKQVESLRSSGIAVLAAVLNKHTGH